MNILIDSQQNQNQSNSNNSLQIYGFRTPDLSDRITEITVRSLRLYEEKLKMAKRTVKDILKDKKNSAEKQLRYIR